MRTLELRSAARGKATVAPVGFAESSARQGKRVRSAYVSAILAVLCAGCASPPHQRETAAAERIAGPTVYARLAQTPAGYRFVALSTQHHTDREPWVRLNNLSPAFSTAPEKECELGTSIVGQLHVKPACTSMDPALFRADQMTGGQKVEKAITTVWTAGTMGTYRITTIVFDVQAYQSAVSQAVAALGMERSEVIAMYAALAEERTALVNTTAALRRKAAPNVKVVDDSGFYAVGSIDFAASVDVKAIPLAPVPDLPLNGPVDRIALQAAFDAGVRSAWARDGQHFSITCGATRMQDFNVTMECPSSATGDELASGVPVTVHVLSKSFYHVLPKTFSVHDKVVSAWLEGSRIQLSNESSDFVSVTTVTVYYAGKAFTVDTNLGLPPHTQLQRPLALDDFMRNLPVADRPSLTVDLAARSAVNFGLAAHYTTSARAATVYREEQFSELALVHQP